MWLKHIEPKAVLLISATLIVLIPSFCGGCSAAAHHSARRDPDFHRHSAGPDDPRPLRPRVACSPFLGQAARRHPRPRRDLDLPFRLPCRYRDRSRGDPQRRPRGDVDRRRRSVPDMAPGSRHRLSARREIPGALGSDGGILLFAVAFGLCNAVPALPVLAAVLGRTRPQPTAHWRRRACCRRGRRYRAVGRDGDHPAARQVRRHDVVPRKAVAGGVGAVACC